MRSASTFVSSIVALALLAGCGSMSGSPFAAMKDKLGPASGAGGSSAAAAAAPAGAASGAAKELPPIDPAVQTAFDNANRAMRAGRFEEAERGYRAIVHLHPELAGPHADLAIIHRRAGRIAESVAELEEAVKLSPDQPVYWNQLGASYRLDGKFPKAREAYERAIALDPGYAAAILNLGILCDLYLGDGKRALELYDRYLALSQGDQLVAKWVADLKNRKPQPITVSQKDKDKP
jgi:Flp pilus assembly protein TadD